MDEPPRPAAAPASDGPPDTPPVRWDVAIRWKDMGHKLPWRVHALATRDDRTAFIVRWSHDFDVRCL